MQGACTASVSLSQISTSRRASLTGCPSGSSAPQAPYERVGDVGNAIFPCGLIHDEPSGRLRLYYGLADTSIGLATAQLEELLAAVLAAPV